MPNGNWTASYVEVLCCEENVRLREWCSITQTTPSAEAFQGQGPHRLAALFDDTADRIRLLDAFGISRGVATEFAEQCLDIRPAQGLPRPITQERRST